MTTPPLEQETVERLVSKVKADLDPTTNPPEFAFTQGAERPTTWHAGTWTDEAGSGNSWSATAVTPKLVGSGSDVALAAGKWVPWIRFTVGDEVPVRKLASITIKG